MQFVRHITAIIALWLAGAESPAVAAPVPLSLKQCGSATVTGALSGDRLETEGGGALLLAAVKAPELWPAGSAYRSWPYAERARRLLEARTKGQRVELFCDAEAEDLEGIPLVHILLTDGRWLQHELVTAGAVLVLPRARQAAGLEQLYAAETLARAETRGLWAGANLLAEADGEIIPGWFKIVRGHVLAANRVDNRVYLNFGRDWRRDFTVEIPARLLRSLGKAGIEPLALEGMQIEARGWIDWRGGPRLLLDAPGQIRILEPAAPASGRR